MVACVTQAVWISEGQSLALMDIYSSPLGHALGRQGLLGRNSNVLRNGPEAGGGLARQPTFSSTCSTLLKLKNLQPSACIEPFDDP